MKSIFFKLMLISPSFFFSISSFSQQLGSTGNPVEWVQVGETKDLLLQIDTNSMYGWKIENDLWHRVDFRFFGKIDEKMTTNAKTAFMMQSDCDSKKGGMTIAMTNSEGRPIGKSDYYEFDLSSETWQDAIGRALCKARQFMMDNKNTSNQSKPSSQLEINKSVSVAPKIKERSSENKEPDKKSIETILEDTLDAHQGQCMALLVTKKRLMPESFDTDAKNYSAKQTAWIRTQSSRVERLGKVRGTKNYTSNEELQAAMIKKMKKPDAEFFWSFTMWTYIATTWPQVEMPAKLALISMSACENAKF